MTYHKVDNVIFPDQWNNATIEWHRKHYILREYDVPEPRKGGQSEVRSRFSSLLDWGMFMFGAFSACVFLFLIGW